jgi:hypothetical protein
MVALGTIAVWSGLFMMALGAVFFIVAAFRESILWGIGVLCLPILQLVFLVIAWPRAKGPFFMQLYGLAFILLGIFALAGRLPLVHWHG